ncbi:CLUMA_CG013311, isoform A [Clunio marinus]|uniref:CLUMA_CG013311, isoform A n=1 Tax=Clunio marinus TaxID=568069 RepID=A0A1J1IIE9_9DIPT|nr:CLUMA_CG013311, isoform A [Clunio marinus]
MSNVPLRFRDWWDDYDLDFDSSFRRPRTSRLIDQHFGTALRRNDLLSSLANTHVSPVRSPYYRPYDISRQDSGSTVNVEKDKFTVVLDVQQFTPDEISVKTNDKFIIIEGKHEEKKDEHGLISRHFVRKYIIPPNYKQENVSSTLSSDGILTITATNPATQASSQDMRSVPVVPVGPQKEASQSKTEEQTSQPKIEQVN